MRDAFEDEDAAAGGEGDTFEGDGDAFEGDGDASGGAFVVFPTPEEHARMLRLALQDPWQFAEILHASASRGSAAARVKLQVAAPAVRLLDRSSPLAPEAIDEQSGWFAKATIGAVDRRAPWEIIGHLRPCLAACVGTRRALVSLTLTAPSEAAIRAYAAALASSGALQSPAGAVMAVDIGPKGGEHIHGIALVEDAAAVRAEWCRLTGARAARCILRTLTGWEKFAAEQHSDLLRNVATVLTYAFKPWPAEHGQRRLREDVIAAGVFVPLWEKVLAALDGDEADAAKAGQSVEPSGPVCQRCGRGMPPGKRRHAQWCSPNCRKAASKAQARRRHAALPAEGPCSG